MRLYPENAVSSFLFYMWNAWSEECKITFGGMHKHFWEKWNTLASESIFGSAERFYAELSDNNRELLVNRAVALYDGKAIRQEKEDSEILVCAGCGSPDVEVKAWINANTNEYQSDVDDNRRDGATNARIMPIYAVKKSTPAKCKTGGRTLTSLHWKA